MRADPLVLGAARKIDPYRRRIANGDTLPDGSPNDADRVEIGPTDLAFEEWAALGLTPPNLERLRAYRPVSYTHLRRCAASSPGRRRRAAAAATGFR